MSYCATGTKTVTDLGRVLLQYRVEGDCWIWTKGTNKFGYGRVMITERPYHSYQESAHRLAYVFHKGETIPKGRVIMHTCDNRACINPDHLVMGTQSENLADMRAKGRSDMTFRRKARPESKSYGGRKYRGIADYLKTRRPG